MNNRSIALLAAILLPVALVSTQELLATQKPPKARAETHFGSHLISRQAPAHSSREDFARPQL